MRSVFLNGRVLTDQGFASDRAVLVEDGWIVSLTDRTDPQVTTAERRVDLCGQMLLPGFIDVQVNGGGGVLFNEQPTVEAIRVIGAAHRRFGTTGFLPTLISDSLDRIEQAMQASDRAAEEVPGVLGIHLEGPFLNHQRKGVHDSSTFRPLDERAFRLLTSSCKGRTLITLAPEMTTPAMITRLTEAGLIVSAGHTEASYEQIMDALAAGLSGFTHLFNAMSPLGSRQPGAVGAALDDGESWCGIIVDQHHVAPASLRIALKAKGAGKLMLVTDAMPGVGVESKSFLLQGRTITIAGAICVDSNGTLAGTNLDMASAVRNAVKLLGVDLPTAVGMASHTPATFLGLGHERGKIAPGYRADLLQVSDGLDVIDSWIGGVGIL